MARKRAYLLFALCLAATSAGLFAVTPLMAPAKSCSSAEFWSAACKVNITEKDTPGRFIGHYYSGRDGYFICYIEGFCGQFLFRVREEVALDDFPKVVVKLDRQLKEEGPANVVLEGYQAWLAEEDSGSDAHLLLRKIRDAHHSYLRKNRLSSYRFDIEDEKEFDGRWKFVRRYWLNVLFEFTYLNGLVVFVFWPWLRRQKPWRKCAHIGLLPFLLMLPYHLGYATFTFTSTGPSGGVLYPLVIVWLRGSYWRWPSLITELFMRNLDGVLALTFPKPLEHMFQPLNSMLSLSGGGAPGVVGSLGTGAAVVLLAFSVIRVVRRRVSVKRGFTGRADIESVRADGQGSRAGFWRDHLKDVMKVALVFVVTFVAVVVLTLLGPLSKRTFVVAAHFGRSRSLRFALLLRPGLINAVDSYGYSGLHAAVEGYKDDAIALLLERGADPNVRSGDGRTPLHRAAEYRQTSICELLLSAGAIVNARDDYGVTPLHELGTVEMLRLLLQHGADINATTPDGRTPLHYAACIWGPGPVEALLANGAVLEARDSWGQTPLHLLAAGNGRPDVVGLLLSKGADLNARTNDGRTPLHIAVRRSDEIVKILLESGAEVNALTLQGLTPLDLVNKPWQQDVRELLLKHGAKSGKELEEL